ncbi:hypothetical protein QUA76_17775, partial [Microcoleus sp. F8-A4]
SLAAKLTKIFSLRAFLKEEVMPFSMFNFRLGITDDIRVRSYATAILASFVDFLLPPLQMGGLG